MANNIFLKPVCTLIHYDKLLRKANFNSTESINNQISTDTNYTLSNGYHIDPTTHYYRVKSEFSGSNIKINDNGLILDWGCSLGVSTLAIANLHKNASVIGLDISKIRIKIAIEKTIKNASIGFVTVYSKNLSCMVREYIDEVNGIRFPKGFIIADGYNAPFNNSTFDAIYCMNNIYYILNSTNDNLALKRIKNILRLIKNNGYLLISGTNNNMIQESIILQNNNGVYSPVYSTFSINNEGSKRKLSMIVDNCNA